MLERAKREVRMIGTALGVLGATVVLGACGATAQSTASTSEAGADAALPQGSEPYELDPADFTTEIDNEYMPMAVGSKWLYHETDIEGTQEVIEVEVLDETKMIANGIEARVVRDTVTEDGEVVEDTLDWYAQDTAGNVWYLGEDTHEYVNGKVANSKGAWEAGVDGALAGVVMPATPTDGQVYRQEWYVGEAEDEAEVLATDEIAEAPFGFFEDVVMTKDLVPLEPKVNEYKMYAPGVGLVEAVHTSGGTGLEQLIEFTPGK